MDTSNITELIQNVIDYIPKIITLARNVIIGLNLPLSTLIIFGGISLILAFIWIRSWFKISKIINYLLLTLLIYIVLNYAGVGI